MTMSQTAADEFQNAAARLAGPLEKGYADDLMSQVQVVPDNPSAAAEGLQLTGRVGANDIQIFGTADNMGIPIFTSDMNFLRGAYAQGVEFDAIMHPAHVLPGVLIMRLTDHLQPMLRLLQRVFPRGVPASDYMALLVVLQDHLSEENLAAVVAELVDGEIAAVANDAAAACSARRPRPKDVERVRAELYAYGMDSVESDF
jgi:Protein of unknown function (DUF1308)/Protein of unknown function (DUF3349)